MPIYEYECGGCGTLFQRLILNKADELDLCCPGCGGCSVKKLISRVAYHVSEQDRIEAFDPAGSHGDSFYSDTRNIGLQARKRARQMGVDLGGGFEEKLETLRTDPGTVLKDGE